MNIEQKAERFRKIKQAAKKIDKERADKYVQKRRDAEHNKYLKDNGLEDLA